MGYKQLPNLDEMSSDDVERMRRVNVWLLPVLFFQQASIIFRDDVSPFTHYLGLAAWALLVIVEIAILSGWNSRWMSARDNAILNDEWHRAAAGDASRWGLAAVAALGVAMVAADRWIAIEGSKAAFVLVNGGMLTAGLRYAWLNRADTDDDD